MSMTPIPVDALPADIDSRRTPVNVYQPIADTLRRSPGQWFIVLEDVNSSAPAHIRRGTIKAFTEGQFEAKGYGHYEKPTEAGNRRGMYAKVYARYVGPALEQQPEPEAPAAPVEPPKPTAPQLTPMQRVALSIAKHHVDARKIVWADLPEDERKRRVEAAGVAYSTVYALIADDMENTVKAKVRINPNGTRA